MMRPYPGGCGTKGPPIRVPQTKAEILRWNDDYRTAVSMDLAERKATAELMDALDDRRLHLASRIADELGQAKVRYYSEGLLAYRS